MLDIRVHSYGKDGVNSTWLCLWQYESYFVVNSHTFRETKKEPPKVACWVCCGVTTASKAGLFSDTSTPPPPSSSASMKWLFWLSLTLLWLSSSDWDLWIGHGDCRLCSPPRNAVLSLTVSMLYVIHTCSKTKTVSLQWYKVAHIGFL